MSNLDIRVLQLTPEVKIIKSKHDYATGLQVNCHQMILVLPFLPRCQKPECVVVFQNHFIDTPPEDDNHGVVGDCVGLRLQFAEMAALSSTC